MPLIPFFAGRHVIQYVFKVNSSAILFFFQAEDGIRDGHVTGSSDVCSSDLMNSVRDTVTKWAREEKLVSQHLSIGSTSRSEERRVGKECRSRWSPYH